jgi:regulator of protease activity HflC (stomatin/prohibitin superfamily)
MINTKNNYFKIKMKLSNNFLKITKRFHSGRTVKDILEAYPTIPSTNYIHSKFNTFINICNQNENIVIERFGQFRKVQKPGIFLAIPYIDKLKYTIDMRELTVPITPQHSITQDNVSLDLGGVVYMKIVDPYKASYGVTDPIFAVTQFAQSTMRAVVGKHSLDEIFHNREKLNDYIVSNLKHASETWGIDVFRYEITEVIIANDIKDAMSRQASAERKRREDVLHAEALKKAQILESEGLKEKLINESEGRKIQVENEALAEANSIRIRTDARKYEVVVSAQAKAEALKVVGEELEKEEAQKAANLEIAVKYIDEFGKVVGRSNSLIIPTDVNDVTGFIGKALSINKMINSEDQLKH